MTSSARYRIHPAIGIARVGNAAPSDFFLGPELPNQAVKRAPDVGTAVPPFKSDGLVKRQAARFRVWEYLENNGTWTASREVSLDDADVVELTWTVHLANRKASFFEFKGLNGSRRGERNILRRNLTHNNTAEQRSRLEIDPLPRSIGGRSAPPVDLSKGSSAAPSQERWPDPAPTPEITSLGQLRTDGAGRLIVIPGAGMAAARRPDPRSEARLTDYANNNGWFDDVGDGPVTVTLKLRGADGTVVEHPVQAAWLLTCPPDFAPPLPQLVCLYDVLFDVAVREMAIPTDESVYDGGELARLSGLASLLRPGATPKYTVDFDTDVAPILRAAFVVTSAFAPAHPMRRMGGTGIDAKLWAELSDPNTATGLRRLIFGRLRAPEGFGAVASTEFNDGMPRILGDDPYNSEPTQWRMFTVTPTQFTILQRWGAGDFLASRLGPPSLLDPPAADTVTPAGLDRAATECASGGPFFPGIEVGWLICEPDLFAEPFRIRHGAPTAYLGDADEERTTVGAGYFSRQMALPWLADFLQCKGEVHPQEGEPGFQEGAPQFRWGWWPSQRPDQVVGRSGQRVAWHRATGPDGEQAIWPDTGTEAEPDRDEFTPSYREMLANWWKFGFIEPQNADGEPITHWNQFAEAERAEQVPALDDTP